MIHRLLSPLRSNSFFLFGARGTGKSTFLRHYFQKKRTLWIDLLDPVQEDRLSLRPQELKEQIEKIKTRIDWVVIDEVQKVPKLLDLVHGLIENRGIRFALTGSSARKLKRGSANLLAGRAFLNHMHPLTHREMGNAFDLMETLRWGSLPKITSLKTQDEKTAFLRTYGLTYLKEEVWAEHVVRQLEPFRKFLEIAAQINGEIINYSNVAQDIGADTKTVQSYFEILQDTLVGFLLEPYHRSVRKQQRHNPKFYFFDAGVKRALDRTLTQEIVPNTYGFGKTFEHFLVIEMHRLNDYFHLDYRFFYLRTKDQAEIDLIIERPGLPTALVEIKSGDKVDERDTRTVQKFLKDFKRAQAFCLSRDPFAKKIGSVQALPWREGLRELGFQAR